MSGRILDQLKLVGWICEGAQREENLQGEKKNDVSTPEENGKELGIVRQTRKFGEKSNKQ